MISKGFNEEEPIERLKIHDKNLSQDITSTKILPKNLSSAPEPHRKLGDMTKED